MRIQDFRPGKGARKHNRRKGRGIGSGRGKTSGRGNKGQKARSGAGAKLPLAFEGGQMPLVRRIPKVGFASRAKKEYSIVNLEKLNIFKDGTHITPSFLKDKRLIRTGRQPLKILGKGTLKKKLTVTAHAFSNSAKSAIEKSGGSAEIIK